MATVPEKVAEATSGSISIRYVTGSTVRGRRNASDPGAAVDVGAGGIRGRLPAALRVVSRIVPAEDSMNADDSAPSPEPIGDTGHDLDVVAIGSPLLDVIEMASDDQLAQVGLEKGSMTLIDLVTANSVQEFMGAPRFVSGGSVANTTAGIAELGGTAGFVGAWPTTRSAGPTPRTCGRPASSSSRTTASRPPATASAPAAAWS